MIAAEGTERHHEIPWLGGTVYTVSFPASDPEKGTVLILHGLGDHLGRYEWAITLLRENGYGVVGIDWPGCGQSSGIRGNLPTVSEAGSLVTELLIELKVEPVGVLAHSTGGFFLAQFLTQDFPALSSLKWAWFSSPLLDPSHGQSALKMVAAKALVRFLPTFTLSTGVYPRDCYHTGGGPGSVNFAEGCHNRISLRFGVDLLDPEKEAVSLAGKIDPALPLLITQGGADHICAPGVAEAFVNQLATEAKAYLFIGGARHEPFREPDSVSFFNGVRAWLRQLE